MLTKLNNRITEWAGFEACVTRTECTAKWLLAVALVGWSIFYWLDAIQSIQSLSEGVSFVLIYGLILTILAWVGVYLAWGVAILLTLATEPFIWLYRKICP
ncbi:TPA: hypothetical protein PW412_000743 [Mannheimia haemolytica]|uniref:Uncharacterized protein n=1 Tax=Mannheimia haemolytica TaxID=75985 RepID=A0A249A3K7_MANHA|nr:hypothetical protein [Mannheimia haemolytica]AWW72169.1 hypothetical protein C4O86_10445 [Pasteurellaceae bacterium 12565]AGI33460.1 hypothetical protein D650_21910 [Mannheimia haemolytica USDA-ARS-USMARC-183]AGK01623.1 hypothetical protein MHH_c11700 [Mannheimia haemolytica M42548]AGQ26434.1 hypothetical protein F382_10975 [Mannheimia haemolytica D153]AGR74372.1 hypothetical protein N220_03080 [Mannheimia haemolytica USMARC_2286]